MTTWLVRVLVMSLVAQFLIGQAQEAGLCRCLCHWWQGCSQGTFLFIWLVWLGEEEELCQRTNSPLPAACGEAQQLLAANCRRCLGCGGYVVAWLEGQ